MRNKSARPAVWSLVGLPGLAAFLLLLLAACAGTPEPTVPPAPRPTAAHSAESVATTTAPPSEPPPAATAPTLPSPAPSPSPTASLSRPTPLPDSPWPTFLRELDLGIAVGNSYGPRAIALHPGLDRIYVRTRSQDSSAPGQVTVLDRAGGQALAIVETGLDSYADGALAVDTDLDRVYAVDADDARASVFDASTLEPVGTIEGVDRLALDASNTRLYVAGLGGLRLLDAEQYDLIHEISTSYAPHFLDLAIAPARDRVYLSYQDDSGYVLAQYDATTLQELASTSLPGQPGDLVPDPKRDRVYVSLSDGQRNLLWTVDGRGQLLEERDLGEWTQKTRLLVDPGGDRLFLGREAYGNHGITILDLENGRELADIPLDLAANALAWDAKAGQFLVSHTYADRLSVVDVETGETVAVMPTALDLVDLAVDPERGHLYTTDSAGRLHVLDSDSDEELATLPGEGQIAGDSPHGRLYTGGQGAKRVRVFDADSLQQTGEIQTTAKPVADAFHGSLYLVEAGVYLASLETMTVTTAISDTLPQYPGFSPNPAAVDAVVDPGSGRVFAIINNGVPGSNGGTYLYVYEPVTYEKTLTDTERSPIYVDVDPSTGRAYVSRTHMAGRSTSLINDGRAYDARLDAVFGPLRVDPALGRVYLTVPDNEEGQLLVLDAGNLDVLGSVPIPGGLSLRALDPQRHLLYLATPGGQVQIWSAVGGRLVSAARPGAAEPPPEEIFRLFRGPGDTPIFTGSLYRSDDEGQTWHRIDNGLPRRGVQNLAVSPDFSQDATLIAGLMATNEGLGIWKSTDGGGSWHMASRGLSDLAVGFLAISPDFAADQTLFATSNRQGLFRSTDGGETWLSLTGRYRPPERYPQPPGGVFVSPTYGQDRTVFVIHEGLYRSTDGGETWVQTLGDLSSLAISPDFAADQTLFAWSGLGGVLRSTDGGETWQPVNVGLAPAGYGSGRVIVSPDFPTSQTLYFFWNSSTTEPPVQFFRSIDAGETWQHLASEPPQAATPVELSADGTAFLALDRTGKLLRWTVSGLDWQPVALPGLDEIEVYDLVLSPDTVSDQTLYALSEGAGILHSSDAGLSWSDSGFPQRVALGRFLKLVLLPGRIGFVGTPLGLYRSDGEGVWSAVADGLPSGIEISSPELGADGSLRVLAGSRGEAQHLYLSTNGGQTWLQPVPPLPRAATMEDLRLSPTFATDRAAFLGVSEGKPWRSTGGGDWEQVGPSGDWHPGPLHLSPTFDRDGLVLMRLQDNSLWRSTDAGDSWRDITGPWGSEAPMAVTRGTGYSLDALTFSPAYGDDGLILTRAGSSLYRSTNQGTTWTEVLTFGPSPAQAAFAPDYARDGTIYLLQGDTVYRSTDRGQRWQALSPGPWDPFDEATLLLSPAFSHDPTMLVWTRAGRLYLSRDGGQSWRDIGRGLPQVGIRQVHFSPDYAANGLLHLVPHGTGLYRRLGDGQWQASGEGESAITAEPPPAPTPTPPPTSKPQPPACDVEPIRFRDVWQEAWSRLGCPVRAAEPASLAEQPFERGGMIWDGQTGQIYVLLESGTWRAYDDTFVEDLDPAYDAGLAPPPRQPQRGFGKVWREQLGGPQAPIGWALEGERPVFGWRQRFDHGLLFWTDATLAGAGEPGTAYLLYDGGTWQSTPAPAP